MNDNQIIEEAKRLYPEDKARGLTRYMGQLISTEAAAYIQGSLIKLKYQHTMTKEFISPSESELFNRLMEKVRRKSSPAHGGNPCEPITAEWLFWAMKSTLAEIENKSLTMEQTNQMY